MADPKEKILKKRTLLQKIVNVFLYAGIVILIILMIFFGFSQTSTFREILRDKVVNIANKNLNGHLSIGKIDGTIFTSLVLRNTEINMGTDTLLNAGVITIKTSPLQIFLKRIFIRKVEISDAKVAFISDSSGILNISKLFTPTPKDTTHSKFPFKIVAPDIKLINLSFSLQDYNFINSRQIYDTLNMHDLRVKNINLSLSSVANIKEDQYELKIDHLSFMPNVKNFQLKNLSGEFYADSKGAYVNNLNLVTDGSDILLSAKLNNFNLFDSTAFHKIGIAGLDVNLKSSKFNFDDLSSFIPATSMLKGTAQVNLDASGSLKALNINRAEINYHDTHLELKGKIGDVIDPEKMFIDVNFVNTRINESDADRLLPSFGIPVYKGFEDIKFDELTYSGNPLNFNFKALMKSSKGDVGVNGALDFRKSDMIYDLNFTAQNLDISSFSGLSTNINASGSIKGSGVSPDNMNSSLKINLDGSKINRNKIDSLKFSAEANNKNINYSLSLRSGSTTARLLGNFDFINKDKPSYKLKGDLKNLNLAEILQDSTMKSSLNMRLSGNGDNFDLDKLNLYLVLDLEKSMVRGENIDSARAILDVRSNDNGERVINLISDLADVTVTGNFSIKQIISLVTKETGVVSNAVRNKMNQILYPDSVFSRQVDLTAAAKTNKGKRTLKQIEILPSSNPTNLKYYVEFKNLDLLSLFLGKNRLNLDGDMKGELKDVNGDIYVSLNSNLDYLKFWGPQNVFFISGMNLNFSLSNNIESKSLKEITSNLQVTIDRIFSGSDLQNLNLNLKLAKNIVDLSFFGNIKNNSFAKLDGQIDLSNSSVSLNLDTLNLGYDQFTFSNKGKVIVNYSKDRIDFNNFDLARNGGEIKIKGFLSRSGNQELDFAVKGLSGKDLFANLFRMNPDNGLDADIFLNAKVTGSFSKPIGTLSFGADGITYKNKSFGSLAGSLNYAEQNLSVDINLIKKNILTDNQTINNKPALLITGTIPVDLSFTGGGDRLIKSKQVDVNLIADNFDLSPLGNAIPGIQNLTGKVVANLKIAGTPDNLDPTGEISVEGANFLVDANNIEYNTGIKLSIKNQNVVLDSLSIANLPNTNGGGTITGGGIATMKNFSLTSIHAAASGSLKVLSEDSKAVSPSVYGDLVLQTEGNIEFDLDSKKSFLKAPIIVKEAKLTFPQTQSAYENTGSNFIYRFVPDTIKSNKDQIDFEHLIQLSQKSNGEDNSALNDQKQILDYNVNVKVQNEAVLKFVLAKEFNQNLTALLKGNIQFEHLNGRSTSQGELTLLDGSTFEFLKTFEATGTIRFESDLSNPYLNIVATYKNYYTPPQEEAKEEPVEVRIKLNGPLNDLSKNFTQDKNNVSVYVGSEDIINDKSDPTKDVSDAVMFILTGKFSGDLTAQQQKQATDSFLGSTAQSTATSLAGSLLGGFLNHYLGDYVRAVELRNVGSTTKFNLVGKVKDFHYTIGGSTDVFSDLSQANVKIEYPIFKNFLIRIERKEAITQTSIANEMINELGLKYRFEF